MNNPLFFPAKMLRSLVIKEYVGDRKVVCFSCGNASSELKLAGVDVLQIAPNGDFTPNRWFTQKEIAEIFPGYFDATPGHLPMELMIKISNRYREYLDAKDLINEKCYDIFSGSGETLVCLKMAYPDKDFIAHYNVKGYEKATEYNEGAPLNRLVKVLALKTIKYKEEET